MLTQDPELSAPDADARSPRSALPSVQNRIVGRARQLAALDERLRSGSVRLLTLTGPGGVGKTRLALEAARAVESSFRDGAAFVSLGAAQRAEDVSAAIVQGLGISLLAGESPDRAVPRYLADRELLLVADNFEHVMAAASFVGVLLDACPALTVLATSREPLALRAEERYLVPPLQLPAREDPGSVATADAVALFVERARAHDAAFRLDEDNAAAVAEICRRLDGLPLAIELGAARCGLLSAAELAERLDGALAAVGAGARDAPARQRTLLATIEWSHQLLAADEQACFARFAVFTGSPTLEAAEAITGAELDTLDRLVAKPAVRRRTAGDSTRLAMLETIRAFASERFAAGGETDAVRERHFRHYLALARRHATDRALWGMEHKRHLAVLDADVDDLHGALGWAVGRGRAEEALALAAALHWYWWVRDRHAHALEWSERALSLPSADPGAEAPLRVRVLCAVASSLLGALGRLDEQPPVMDEAEALARAHADPVLLARGWRPVRSSCRPVRSSR